MKPYKRCVDKLIKKNYYRNNTSLGACTDFEMAWQGKPSPYLSAMNMAKAGMSAAEIKLEVYGRDWYRNSSSINDPIEYGSLERYKLGKFLGRGKYS